MNTRSLTEPLTNSIKLCKCVLKVKTGKSSIGIKLSAMDIWGVWYAMGDRKGIICTVQNRTEEAPIMIKPKTRSFKKLSCRHASHKTLN